MKKENYNLTPNIASYYRNSFFLFFKWKP